MPDKMKCKDHELKLQVKGSEIKNQVNFMFELISEMLFDYQCHWLCTLKVQFKLYLMNYIKVSGIVNVDTC